MRHDGYEINTPMQRLGRMRNDGYEISTPITTAGPQEERWVRDKHTDISGWAA
jgi:hypothetical protein